MWLGVEMDLDVAGDRDGPWMWLGVGMDVAGGRDGCGWG